MVASWSYQESVVGVGLEDFFRSVEQESERQEDLDVGSGLQNSFVDWLGVLKLIDTHGIVTRHVADSVKRIEDYSLWKT